MSILSSLSGIGTDVSNTVSSLAKSWAQIKGAELSAQNATLLANTQSQLATISANSNIEIAKAQNSYLAGAAQNNPALFGNVQSNVGMSIASIEQNMNNALGTLGSGNKMALIIGAAGLVIAFLEWKHIK